MTHWEDWKDSIPPISADDSWQKMNSLLDKRPSDEDNKKKRWFFIWWIILLFFVLIGAITLLDSNSAKKQDTVNTQRHNQSHHAAKEKGSALSPKKQIGKSASSMSTIQQKIPKKDRQLINKIDTSKRLIKHTDLQPVGKKSVLNKRFVANNGSGLPSSNESAKKNGLRRKVTNFYANQLPKATAEQPKEVANFKQESLKKDEGFGLILKNRSQPNTQNVRVVSKKFLGIRSNNRFQSNQWVNHTIIKNKEIKEIPQSASKWVDAAPKSNSSAEILKAVDGVPDLVELKVDTNVQVIKAVSNIPDTTTALLAKDDTLKASTKPAKNKTGIFSQIGGGLQWNISLPPTNNNGNTNKQVIPGIWVQKEIGNKSSISVSFNPYVMQTNAEIVIVDKTGSLNSIAPRLKVDQSWFKKDSLSGRVVLDTAIKVNRKVSILQSFGYRAALDYRYALSKKWQLTCGIEYNQIISAYMDDKIIRVRDNLLAQDISSDNKEGSALWSFFDQSFFSGNLAIVYTPINRLFIGLGMHQPLSSLSNNVQQKVKPSAFYLNIRWKIWEKK
jgi:hypothetical protein